MGELESQVDTFEAEIEGLTVKKGKTRPPRLVGDKITHLIGTRRKSMFFLSPYNIFCNAIVFFL